MKRSCLFYERFSVELLGPRTIWASPALEMTRGNLVEWSMIRATDRNLGNRIDVANP